jgi:TatD DNase family protein
VIDAHIHLDQYTPADLETVMKDAAASGAEKLLAVSTGLASCEKTLSLSRLYSGRVLPAYGFHPEQPLPEAEELDRLLIWMSRHRGEMTAIGEVGLPYYLRKEAEAAGRAFALSPYIELLDTFISLAVRWDKPIVLHAVYEDADRTIERLRRYGLTRAHFHWYKGNRETTERLISAGFYISVTPDVVYETEIQDIVRRFPLERLMVETDGPWPFSGPFAGRLTSPGMIRQSLQTIAAIKNLPLEHVARAVYENTKRFFRIVS